MSNFMHRAIDWVEAKTGMLACNLFPLLLFVVAVIAVAMLND